MSEDKPSNLEIIGAFTVLGVAITIYVVVSNAVVSAFWWLVLKLFGKIVKK